jgi:hypothetical protein
MALPIYRVAGTVSGNAPHAKEYTSAGTISAGEFVVLGAGGTVTAAGNDPAAVLGLATASVTTGLPVVVVHAHPDVIFSGFVATGAPVDATDIGSQFSCDTAGVDLSDATGIAIVHGLDATDSDATAGDRVLFSIRAAAYAGGPGGIAV